MPIATSLSYLGAIVLTAAFVQTFEIWQVLLATLGGQAALVPFAALAAIALPMLARSRPAPVALALGLAAAGMALVATDPAFPAKRIHVAEYVLLAFVVRFGAARVAAGRPLTLIVAVLTALLGAHDEMLQGLHPDRSFALRDIGVDALAALAGALLGHRPAPAGARPSGPWLMPVLLPLAGLALELGAVAAHLEISPPPLWAAAPVLGATLAALLAPPRGQDWPAHLGRMVTGLVAVTPLYVVLPHVAPLAFR